MVNEPYSDKNHDAVMLVTGARDRGFVMQDQGELTDWYAKLYWRTCVAAFVNRLRDNGSSSSDGHQEGNYDQLPGRIWQALSKVSWRTW